MAEMTEITEISGETIIGDIVEKLPGGAEIIEKYFGNGCFTCPGIRMESIGFGATMHGVNAEEIVAELKALVKSG